MAMRKVLSTYWRKSFFGSSSTQAVFKFKWPIMASYYCFYDATFICVKECKERFRKPSHKRYKRRRKNQGRSFKANQIQADINAYHSIYIHCLWYGFLMLAGQRRLPSLFVSLRSLLQPVGFFQFCSHKNIKNTQDLC